MRARIVGVVFVLGLAAVGAGVAGLNSNWSTHANGSMEVPARDTQGQGQAIFHLSQDGTQLDYKVIASNIENVFQAHIHMAPAGCQRRDSRVALSVDHAKCPRGRSEPVAPKACSRKARSRQQTLLARS